MKWTAMVVAAGLLGMVANAQETGDVKNIYDFALPDIDGKEVRLADYRGKVLLLVNTASRCGYTKQYAGLEELHKKYTERGFYVLGFPANNFGGQEPGENAEIKEFCSAKFGVSFPMFGKISVMGDDQHPLYAYLTGEQTNPEFSGPIKWNFNKFLVGRDGTVIGRFESKDTPEGEKIVTAVEGALE